jgi:hypothetical protein
MTTTILNFKDKFGGNAADDETTIGPDAQIEIGPEGQTFALNVENDTLTLTSQQFANLFTISSGSSLDTDAFYTTTLECLTNTTTQNALKAAYNVNLDVDKRREVLIFNGATIMAQLQNTRAAIQQVTMKSDSFTKLDDKLQLVYTFVITDSKLPSNLPQEHKVAITHKWVPTPTPTPPLT